jgi:hypothetical protein
MQVEVDHLGMAHRPTGERAAAEMAEQELAPVIMERQIVDQVVAEEPEAVRELAEMAVQELSF